MQTKQHDKHVDHLDGIPPAQHMLDCLQLFLSAEASVMSADKQRCEQCIAYMSPQLCLCLLYEPHFEAEGGWMLCHA